MTTMRKNKIIPYAEANLTHLKNKNYGELHVPLCSLNLSSKSKPKKQDANHSFRRSFDDEFKWRAKGGGESNEEDDTNCCIRNIPCPMVEFQFKKIKQLAESGRPWMNTNLKTIKNYGNSKEEYYDFRTYSINPKLSILSPDHKIHLYKVGTFSNESSSINDLESDVYNGKAYLEKFKSFDYISRDGPALFGRHQKICKPLEFAIPSSFVHELKLRYKEVLHSKTLDELEEELQLEEELSCNEEYNNKKELHECKNYPNIDEMHVSYASDKDQSNSEALKSENLAREDHDLNTVSKKEEQRMEEGNIEDIGKQTSPTLEHVQNELQKLSISKSNETSILDFNNIEAETRTHHHDDLEYLGAGPSYRKIEPDDDPFFRRNEEEQQVISDKTSNSTFIYKMSLGYSNPTQLDQIRKALLDSTVVMLEGTREPSQDLTKLLQLLREAHPMVKKKSATYEERKSDAIKEMVAKNHPCLVYKLQIKCEDMDQVKKLEESLLDTSVIVFSCVSPSFPKNHAAAPTFKMQVEKRIKDIFNLGPPH